MRTAAEERKETRKYVVRVLNKLPRVLPAVKMEVNQYRVVDHLVPDHKDNKTVYYISYLK